MNVYMLKGTFKDGEIKYYCQTEGIRWVTQQEGSVWTNRRGPGVAENQAQEYYHRRQRQKAPELEIEEFILMKPSAHVEAGNLELVKVSFGPMVALYIHGDLCIYGQYSYHIDARINGIVEGARLLFPDVILGEFYVADNECLSIDVRGVKPPLTFAACLNEFPVTSEHPK